MRKIYLIVCLCTFLFASQSHSAENVNISGYYKNFFMAIEPVSIDSSSPYDEGPVEGLVQNRFRCKIFWSLNECFSLLVAYDSVPTVTLQESSALTELPAPDPKSYRISDIHDTLYPQTRDPEGSFYLGQNLDRLLLEYSADVFDLTLGRQPIAFGSARVINPTDVLAPFTYDELDKEERTGVDAVRLTIPLGMMSEFDLGVVFGEDFESDESAVFLRTKLYIKQTDVTCLALAFKENFLVGVDVARSIGGAGFWFETAYVFDSLFADDEPDKTTDYLRISTGLDYRLTEDLYGYVEYHFNEAGETTSEDYFDLLGTTAFTEGGVYLFGQHYLCPGINYQISPLWSFSETIIANLTDPSVFTSSILNYNIAEDVYLELGVLYGIGEHAELMIDQNSQTTLVPHSEFGLYSPTYYTSIRLYF